MVRAPDIPPETHQRIDVLTSLNRLTIPEGYTVVIDAVVTEDGRVNPDAVEELREKLPAEDASAF